MGMEPLFRFGYVNSASFRIRIWDLSIFQDSDAGLDHHSGLGFEKGVSFRNRIWEYSVFQD